MYSYGMPFNFRAHTTLLLNGLAHPPWSFTSAMCPASPAAVLLTLRWGGVVEISSSQLKTDYDILLKTL
ncbi:hypothetical protein CUMW_066020 [Citrus unshiu]|nr:hypothetical protein CUMW_066020 [Citrus unshiu]